MLVIPVLDVRRGQAVHAVAGNRDHYAPLRSVLHHSSDPVVLARASRDAWLLPDLYLADLDSILGEAPPNMEMVRAIAGLGFNLWLDAGIRDLGEIGPLLDAKVARIVVGLESIRSPEALARVVAEIGPERLVFSLDLKEGRPLIDTRPAWGTDQAFEVANLAIVCGVRSLIHLDLARVGSDRGVAEPILPRPPGIEWIIGGGVAGLDDLLRLAKLAFDGVLVGSALHDGRIGREALHSFLKSLGQS